VNSIEITYYFAVFCPLAWLVWLASRPFLVNLNRVLLLVVGAVLYGYFMKIYVIPLTNAARTYVVANLAQAKIPEERGIYLNEGVVAFNFYVGMSLAAVLLLMSWLKRSLARTPR
jgi:hypothetical protein